MLCATHISPDQETHFPNAGALHWCEGSLRDRARTAQKEKERITALWTVDQQKPQRVHNERCVS